MTDPQRAPRTPGRAEGDPPGEEVAGGRTPHPDQPAEGQPMDDEQARPD